MNEAERTKLANELASIVRVVTARIADAAQASDYAIIEKQLSQAARIAGKIGGRSTK